MAFAVSGFDKFSTGSAAKTFLSGCTIPSGITAGDEILIWVSSCNTASSISIGGTASTFSQEYFDNANGGTSSLFSHAYDGTEGWTPGSTTFTVLTDATARTFDVIIVGLSGTTQTIEAQNGGNNASNTVIPNSGVTTTTAGCLLVWFGSYDQGSGGTPGSIVLPTGYTAFDSQINTTQTTNSNIGALAGTRTFTGPGSTGSQNGSRTGASGSHDNASYLVALPPGGIGASITASAIAGAATLVAPGVGAGAGLTAIAVHGTATLPAPSNSAGSAATPSAVHGTATLPVPGLSTGTTLSASAIHGQATFPSVSLSLGSSLTATAINGTVTFPAPVVGTLTVVSPAAIHGTTTFGTVSLSAGSTVTGTSIHGVASLPAPTVSAGASLTASAVHGQATLPAPVLSASVSLAAVAISALAHIPAPFVTTLEIRVPFQFGGTVVNTHDLGGTVAIVEWNATLDSQLTFDALLDTQFELTGTAEVVDPLFAGTVDDANDFGGSVSDFGLGGTVEGFSMQAQNIQLGEFNDEVLNLTVSQAGSPFDLTDYTLNAYLKTAAGVADDDASTIVLSSSGGSPAIIVTDAAAGEFQVTVPHADLENVDITFWRVDVVDGDGNQNTAMYGTVTILPL